ncbi:MAG: signal peptidase I [Planctomycetota bacterium]|jgi:signal peptidase I
MAKRKRKKKKRDKSSSSSGAEPAGRDRPPARAGRDGAADDAARPPRSAGAGKDKGRPPGHPDRAPGKDSPEKSATRSFIETIVTVVVLVLLLRWLLIEAFKIPSSSMEPTLIGHPYHGDRVLAWKPSRFIGTPSRWSVLVFVKHPDRDEIMGGETSDRNFIKRLVGLPGERVLIASGDIFLRGEGDEGFAIARKPPGVQERVWHTVHEAEGEKWPDGKSDGKPDSGPVRWETSGGLARDAETGAISGRAEGRAWAHFATNHYNDDNGVVSSLFLRSARLDLVCPHCGERFEADISTARTRLRCPSTECGKWLDVLKDNLVVDDAGVLECPNPACKRYVGNLRKELATGSCPHCKRDFKAPRLATAMGVPGRYPSSGDAEEPVSDIRVSLDVCAAGDEDGEARGRAFVEIALDDDRYVAGVPLAGGRARVTGPAWPEGIESAAPVAPFEPGVARRVSFAHVDQEVILRIGGEEIINEPYDAGWEARAGGPKTNSVRVGLEDAEATLDRMKIERDLHYIARGSPNVMEYYSGARRRWEAEPVKQLSGLGVSACDGDAVRTRARIGRAEFLMLGDNSPSSDDGRRWGYVARGDLVGKAFVLFWPPNRMRWLR